MNSNDHPPPHVDVFGMGREARFRLNCPDGPVEFWDAEGNWTLKHLNQLGSEIAAEIGKCCSVWGDIHG